MIDAYYTSQLEQQYKTYCRNIIAGKPFVQITLRGGKNKPENTVALHQLISQFQKHEKNASTPGWSIDWAEWNSKKLGKQKWPRLITVDTEEDYLFLLNKEKEIKQFKLLVQELLHWRIAIQDFLIAHPQTVMQYQNDWEGIRRVVDYLDKHPIENHYIRSIPVPVHTKFIQSREPIILALLKHFSPAKLRSDSQDLETALGLKKKTSLFTLRFLDPSLAISCMNGIEIIGLTPDTLKESSWPVKEIWLVENETNLYLMPERKDAIVIFSKGYAMDLLYGLPLFQAAKLFYWGDLDEDGFVMLHRIRKHYPHLRSVFMDAPTIALHQEEIGKQPGRYKIEHLEFLTEEEKQAYDILKLMNGRLEQEKLRQEFIIHGINQS